VIADGIASGLFPHRPPDDDGWGGRIPCAYCDPDGLGAGEHRERWSRKSTDPRLAGYVAMIGDGS
jgi:ATP-dependent helicase/nuclease subunit B